MYFAKKKIYTGMFMSFVLGYSALNLPYALPHLKDVKSSAEAEQIMTENLLGRMSFIEGYSLTNKFMNKSEVNNFDIVKDPAGFLHYPGFYQDHDSKIFNYAMRVKRLQEYAEKQGTKVLFVIPPEKFNADIHNLDFTAPTSNPKRVVEELLFYLNRLGVHTLDLSKQMPNENIPYEDVFFKTDHHWTIPAAFTAAEIVTNHMSELFNHDLNPKDKYLSSDLYEKVVYPDVFLGSMGRRTGIHFSGLEDFTAYWPKFTGKFTWTTIDDGDKEVKKGSFEQALMKSEVLEEEIDLHTKNPYSLYLEQVNPYDQIINHDLPKGKKMLMVRDSYFGPVMAFMAPMFSQIDSVWNKNDDSEYGVEKLLEKNKYDYVVIEMYPENIDDDGFNYFKEEEVKEDA